MPPGACPIARLAGKSQTRLGDQHFHFQRQLKWLNMIAPAAPTEKHRPSVSSAGCTRQSREPTLTRGHMRVKTPLPWETRGWCWGAHRRASTPSPFSCVSAQSPLSTQSARDRAPCPAAHRTSFTSSGSQEEPRGQPPTFLTVCKGRPSPRPMKVPAPLNSATCHAHFHPVITTAGVTEVPTGPRCLPRSCCQNLPLSHWSRLEGEAGHGCRLRAGVDQLQAVCAAPGESWWD